MKIEHALRSTPTMLLLAGVLLGAPLPAAAQRQPAEAREATDAASDSLWVLELTDGSSLYGRVVEETEERVVLVTRGGSRVEVGRAEIRSLEPLRGRVVEGEIWPRDRNQSRLIFGPTGRPIPRGDGYVGVYELFFSFVAVGVTDRLILAGGTLVLPGAFGEVLYLAPKMTLLERENASLAAGAIGFFIADEIDEGSAGIVYGAGTFGDGDGALTVGAGWGFSLYDGDADLTDEPALLLGGEVRTSRRFKMITENYLFPSEGAALLGVGGRFLGDRFTADVGVGGALGKDGGGCCLPLLSVMYGF